MKQLDNPFERHFEIVTANSPSLLDEAYKLRYQVYCEERGYEDADRYPKQREFDEFDGHSIHSLIRHQDSGEYVGVVRLVLPNKEESPQFPILQHCELTPGQAYPKFNDIPLNAIGEVSRFLVSPVFRRRSESGAWNSGVDIDRKLMPHVSLGLVAAVIRMCEDNDIQYLYAMLEPTLLRFLTRFGVQFHVLGRPVDHRGMRVPALVPAETIFTIIQKRPDLWRITGCTTSPFAERIVA